MSDGEEERDRLDTSPEDRLETRSASCASTPARDDLVVRLVAAFPQVSPASLDDGAATTSLLAQQEQQQSGLVAEQSADETAAVWPVPAASAWTDDLSDLLEAEEQRDGEAPSEPENDRSQHAMSDEPPPSEQAELPVETGELARQEPPTAAQADWASAPTDVRPSDDPPPSDDPIAAASHSEAWSQHNPFSIRPHPDHSLALSAAVIAETAAPAEPARPAAWRGGNWRRPLSIALKVVAALAATWVVAVLTAIVVFRFVDPPGSMLMLANRVAGNSVDARWVDIDHVSPELVRAVITAEDGRFCKHWGIDLREIANAIARSRGGIPRGASTITMQVAKNMFLWPTKSYVRKALEVPLTLAIEVAWPKRRILEVYLNIAEWGPGIFGIERAAQYHFRKPAARLGRTEAALLAVALPNPIERRAGRPGPGTRRLARLIEARARSARDSTTCIWGAK